MRRCGQRRPYVLAGDIDELGAGHRLEELLGAVNGDDGAEPLASSVGTPETPTRQAFDTPGRDSQAASSR